MRGTAAILLVLSAAACRSGVHRVQRAGVAMGSELKLTASTADEVAARAAFDAVFAEFERLEALMSTWRPGSDVLRINAAAGVEPVPVAADVRDVLHRRGRSANGPKGRSTSRSVRWPTSGSSITIRTTPSRRRKRFARGCR